jgi:hypothetical protein
MASLTIDGVGTELQRRLAALAEERGSSMQEEALRVMAEALHVPPTDQASEPPMTTSHYPGELTGAEFVALVRAAVDKYGPLDFEIPPRGPSHREIPDFGE